MDRLRPALPPTQLPLPLDVANPSLPPVLRGPRLLPQRLWRGLPGGQRTQVRSTILRVCQEVVRDRAGWP